MSSSVPLCHVLFHSIGSGDSGDVFVADESRIVEDETVVAINLVIEVGNVAVVTLTCHDESESGCVSRDKYFCDSRDV